MSEIICNQLENRLRRAAPHSCLFRRLGNLIPRSASHLGWAIIALNLAIIELWITCESRGSSNRWGKFRFVICDYCPLAPYQIGKIFSPPNFDYLDVAGDKTRIRVRPIFESPSATITCHCFLKWCSLGLECCLAISAQYPSSPLGSSKTSCYQELHFYCHPTWAREITKESYLMDLTAHYG